MKTTKINNSFVCCKVLSFKGCIKFLGSIKRQEIGLMKFEFHGLLLYMPFEFQLQVRLEKSDFISRNYFLKKLTDFFTHYSAISPLLGE
jgi:hypothetical protein